MQKQGMNDPVFSVKAFREELSKIEPEAVEIIDNICAQIRPRFVYNMVETETDTEIFANIDQTLADVLSIHCDHLGIIPYDANVRQFLRHPGIFQAEQATSLVAATIDQLARRVINYWDEPLEGSAELLANYARGTLTS
jgi:MinD-like ATPase involved in chromosome partitioning or flagellar assembly